MKINITSINLDPATGGGGNSGGGNSGGENSGEGKIRLPNGITLANSTFTEFDMGQHDWGCVYDYEGIFTLCFKLAEVKNIPVDVRPLNCNRMFFGCQSLVTAPAINTSECVCMNNMFNGTNKLENVPYYNTSKVKDFESMFGSCNMLSSTSEFDLSSATTTKSMFRSCNKLTYVQFRGNPVNLTDTTDMFRGITSTGRMFYPAEYAENYQIIIDRLPATWTAIAY